MEQVVLVAVGLVALIVGAEWLVRGGSGLAARLGIPPIVVGLTVVSIGTSMPEMAVGVDSALQGNGSLAVGNVTGTNVVNMLLILGMSAAIRPLALRTMTVRFDLPLMAIAAIALFVMSRDGTLSRVDGAILLLFAAAYTVAVVWLGRRENTAVQAEFESEYAAPSRRDAARGTAIEVGQLLVGLVVIVLGAEWLVDGSVQIAESFGVSDALIGLTIVAIGTSAPELVTTIVSTIRGNRDIAIGNLFGSSVYNIALILGVTTVVAPVPLDAELVRVDIPLMTAIILLCIPVFVTGRRVTRAEGMLFVAGYAAYLAYLIVART